MSKIKRQTRRQKVENFFYDRSEGTGTGTEARSDSQVRVKKINPRNYKQELALESLTENTLTVLTGPPGTAKTLLATYSAYLLLEAKKIEKIYYVKPIVKMAADIGPGFLPGDLREKTAFDSAPVEDALRVFLPPQKVNYLLEKKIVEFMPLAYLRGRSLNYCFVIADEMQNSMPESVFTVLTRIGCNSKVCLIGDKIQRDLSTKFGLDGLSDLCERINYSHKDDVGFVHFGIEDSCRSGFVRKILNHYKDLYTS